MAMHRKLTIIFVVSLLYMNTTKAALAASVGPYLLDARGSGMSLGKLHGQKMRKDIKERIEVWNALLIEHVGLAGKPLLKTLRQSTGWFAQIEQHTPELLTEIRAIAQATEVDYASLLTYNLAEEIMTWQGKGYQACSNLSAFTQSGVGIAYNLDIPIFLHGRGKPYVLRIDEDTWILGFPGLIATTVVSKAFTLTTNSLPMLRHDIRGLPLPFMLRMLAKLPDLNAVKQRLRETPLGVAQNFMAAGVGDITNIEKSQQSIRFSPARARLVKHTNFPIYNKDLRASTEVFPVCKRYAQLSEFELLVDNGPVSADSLLGAILDVREADTFFSLLVHYKHAAKLPDIEIIMPGSMQRIPVNSIDQN